MRAKKAQQIAEITDAPGEIQKGYLANWLVACTLPHRDPKTTLYVRSNGDCTLTLQSGADKGQLIGLPYGSLARLVLFWLISEANRTRSRRLYLGGTIDGFLRDVGLDPKTGGGKRGDATRLREQMHRLFRCHFSFTRTQTTERGKSLSWLDMQVAPKGELWWDVKDLDQVNLFENWIELGEDFFNAVTTNPVPIDFRALCALKHSPMAMDLYAWLTWRVHSMKPGSSATIPLHGPNGLAQQIGSEYNRADNFKAALTEGLAAVRLVWPKLHCTLTARHLVLYQSGVPVPDVPAVKKRRALGQVKAEELSVETRIWLTKTYPDLKARSVWSGYRKFLAREKITPHDIDAHFKDYAKKWAKGEL
jgi:hypothetical protein